MCWLVCRENSLFQTQWSSTSYTLLASLVATGANTCLPTEATKKQTAQHYMYIKGGPFFNKNLLSNREVSSHTVLVLTEGVPFPHFRILIRGVLIRGVLIKGPGVRIRGFLNRVRARGLLITTSTV